nr:carotenoid oxygenase family protein [Pseudomonas sp. HS-2]
MKFPDTPFFTGHNAPVRMEVDLSHLVVSGTLPTEVRGTWYRMSAEPMFPPKDGNDIFVAGDGMVSALKVEDNGVHFRTRYVQTERLQREMAAGRGLYGFYRNPFRDDPSVQGTHRGTANTTPIWHGGRLLCAKEDSLPYEVDPQTLETKGVFNYGGKLRSPNVTAHPKFDPQTGEMHFFGYECGGEATRDIAYCVADKDGNLVREEWAVAPDATMMHDFAVSRDHVVFMSFPTTTDLDRLKSGGAHWVWDGSKPSWFGVVRRDKSLENIRWFRWSAACSFHVMNTVSTGNKIAIDMMLARRNPFPEVEDINGAPYNPEDGAPFLTRLTIDLDAEDGNIQTRQLAPMPGEMPLTAAVDQMRPYRIGYYAGIDPTMPLEMTGPVGAGFNHLCRVDVETGELKAWRATGRVTLQEPVHIASKQAGHEGYLLVMADKHSDGHSSALVFEAATPERGPLCEMKLPYKLRQGIHGTWVPAT